MFELVWKDWMLKYRTYLIGPIFNSMILFGTGMEDMKTWAQKLEDY